MSGLGEEVVVVTSAATNRPSLHEMRKHVASVHGASKSKHRRKESIDSSKDGESPCEADHHRSRRRSQSPNRYYHPTQSLSPSRYHHRTNRENEAKCERTHSALPSQKQMASRDGSDATSSRSVSAMRQKFEESSSSKETRASSNRHRRERSHSTTRHHRRSSSTRRLAEKATAAIAAELEESESSQRGSRRRSRSRTHRDRHHPGVVVSVAAQEENSDKATNKEDSRDKHRSSTRKSRHHHHRSSSTRHSRRGEGEERRHISHRRHRSPEDKCESSQQRHSKPSRRHRHESTTRAEEKTVSSSSNESSFVRHRKSRSSRKLLQDSSHQRDVQQIKQKAVVEEEDQSSTELDLTTTSTELNDESNSSRFAEEDRIYECVQVPTANKNKLKEYSPPPKTNRFFKQQEATDGMENAGTDGRHRKRSSSTPPARHATPIGSRREDAVGDELSGSSNHSATRRFSNAMSRVFHRGNKAGEDLDNTTHSSKARRCFDDSKHANISNSLLPPMTMVSRDELSRTNHSGSRGRSSTPVVQRVLDKLPRVRSPSPRRGRLLRVDSGDDDQLFLPPAEIKAHTSTGEKEEDETRPCRRPRQRALSVPRLRSDDACRRFMDSESGARARVHHNSSDSDRPSNNETKEVPVYERSASIRRLVLRFEASEEANGQEQREKPRKTRQRSHPNLVWDYAPEKKKDVVVEEWEDEDHSSSYMQLDFVTPVIG